MQSLLAIFMLAGPVWFLFFWNRQRRRLSTQPSEDRTDGEKGQRIFHLVLLFSLIFWPLLIFGALFLFDAPGSDNVINIGLASSVVFYPAPVLIGYLGFRKGWEGRDGLKMQKSTWVALMGPMAFVIFFTLMSTICNGKLACR